MRTFFRYCRALVSLFLICGPVHAVSDGSWPTAPKLIELPTPFGTLAVSESEYVYEAQLKLNGVLIDPPISGMLNISYAFELNDRQAALVSISKGNDACPVLYRWVILKADGYHVSPEFGSCSEHIRVSADARKLMLQTPSREAPGLIDTYVFDGKSVTQRTSKKK